MDKPPFTPQGTGLCRALKPKKVVFSAEHSCVEFKWPRVLEFDLAKLSMGRIEQEIPFALDCCRWDKQNCCLSVLNPFIPEMTKRFVPRFVPIYRKNCRVESSNLHIVRN